MGIGQLLCVNVGSSLIKKKKKSDTLVRDVDNGDGYSCIGEGNDNPLQYTCRENPMDGGAWWATVHRVAKSRT